jgi:3-hydroxyisobutyrate dehydrogenase-like beta-hydroxyacid dehydrogenase
MKVGFIGLGNMGQGMSDNLLSKGTDLTVFTRTKSKIDAMVSKGAKGAKSIEDIANNCDLILTCLPDVQTSKDIFLGDNGLVNYVNSNHIVVDHSTVDISTSKECFTSFKNSNASFLDAPISGGPLGASGGTLAIMVGGDNDTYEKALPYFERMGANIKYMGPSGAGTAMKLINQLLVGVNTLAAAEAFALANSAGVNIDAAAELLSVSWGGSTMVERSAPITSKRDFPDSAAPVRNLDKDLGIIRNLSEDEGLSLLLALTAEKMFKKLMDDGKPDHDIAGVIEIIEDMSS